MRAPPDMTDREARTVEREQLKASVRRLFNAYSDVRIKTILRMCPDAPTRSLLGAWRSITQSNRPTPEQVLALAFSVEDLAGKLLATARAEIEFVMALPAPTRRATESPSGSDSTAIETEAA